MIHKSNLTLKRKAADGSIDWTRKDRIDRHPQ
jgi:hypothetical protein